MMARAPAFVKGGAFRSPLPKPGSVIIELTLQWLTLDQAVSRYLAARLWNKRAIFLAITNM